MKRLLLPAALFAALALAGCQKPGPAASKGEGAQAAATFLAANAKKPGVVTLTEGVQYQVIASGPAGGVSPGPGDFVRVMYEGRLLNGDVFDSSYESGQPAIFTPDSVVPGWGDVLQKMKPGDIWNVWLSPEKGYGAEGKGPIPPNSGLQFKIELQAVEPR